MLSFATPLAFLLLVPVGIAALWVYRRRVLPALLFSATHRIPAQGSSWRTRLTAWLPALFILGLVLCVIALSRPRSVFSVSHRSADALALYMVVDLSGSMQALDLSEQKPMGDVDYKTRLDVVKTAFANLVHRRPDDLIGLITFGGYAATRVPLTADHRMLLHVLNGVEIAGNPVDQEENMTAIGDALATACARLENSPLKSRVIILLTDGVSNTGLVTPEEALALTRKMNLRVYTIGVGSKGRAPFWARDIFGRKTLGWAEVEFDDAFLKHAAASTQGRYFNVTDAPGMEESLSAINELETTRIQHDQYHTYHEHFPAFLWSGIALMFLATGMNLHLTRRMI